MIGIINTIIITINQGIYGLSRLNPAVHNYDCESLRVLARLLSLSQKALQTQGKFLSISEITPWNAYIHMSQ